MAVPFIVPRRTKTTSSIVNHFLDLRKELHELFYGHDNVPGVSFEIILRKVDKTQRCPCWNFIKKEADPNCSRCKGTGWLVYDKIYRTVKRKYVGKEEYEAPGLAEIDSTLFFFEYSAEISESDSIIEVRTDDFGKIVSPVKFLKTHSIKDVEPLRFSNGRVEFYKIFASKSE